MANSTTQFRKSKYQNSSQQDFKVLKTTTLYDPPVSSSTLDKHLHRPIQELNSKQSGLFRSNELAPYPIYDEESDDSPGGKRKDVSPISGSTTKHKRASVAIIGQ